MELYLGILKLFLNREIYEQYKEDVDRNFIRNNFPELLKLFHAVDEAHKIEPKDQLEVVDVEAVFYSQYPKADPSLFAPLFRGIAESTASPKAVGSFLSSAHKRRIATELAFAALDVGEGKNTGENLEVLIKSFQAASEQEKDEAGEVEFVNDDIEELYDKAIAEPGLSWRLQSLRRALGPLRKGDFGFVFARPETGKTTFLADAATCFSEQTEGPILWINNEEQDEKVLLRCYEAALGAPLEKILLDKARAREYYGRHTGNRIKFPRGDFNNRKGIELLCKRLEPSLIIVDQLDKVQGFEADREDLRLGSIYQWARELAKRYAPVIGVSQSDGSGEGQKWLNMGNVANAKTAKQAEADWILGIGMSYLDPPNVRGFSICKNKLVGGPESVPALRHGRFEVLIEPEIARYRDIHIGENRNA